MNLTTDAGPIFSEEKLYRLHNKFKDAHPDEILKWGFDHFSKEMVLGTGFGPSGVFLIHRIVELGLSTPAFFLDTHLHFNETYALKEEIEERFDIEIEAVQPSVGLDEQASEYGPELWKHDPDKCCHLRKV